MEEALSSAVYLGHVTHKRLRPFKHRLDYRVFSLLVDLEEVSQLGRRLRVFSHNRPNLLSFHDRDHGPRDGSPLRPWIDKKLAEVGLDPAGGPVRILCFPRMLGYVFNPLSVWYCHHSDGRLVAVLYEVSNTFGEHHSYLIPVPTESSSETLRQQCKKHFYVSPFIAMAATYHFSLQAPGERLQLAIREDDQDGPLLVASHVGKRRPFDDRTLLRAAAAHPLMTVKVIAGIHWEALKMVRKGARFVRRPTPPTRSVSFHPNTNDPAVAAAE